LEKTDSVRTKQKFGYLKKRNDLILRVEAFNAADTKSMGLFARTVTCPIGGCFLMTLHLIDGLFMAQTEETFHTVAQSKLNVFKAFHSAFDVGSLGFFVSFSSMMAVTGNIGQSNYATANVILDGELKKYPNAFSIMIPGISNIGYLSRSEGDAEHSRLDSWSITSDGERTFLTRRSVLMFYPVLFACIKDGLQLLAAGARCPMYVPPLSWDGVERDMGFSPICVHLHSQDPSESPGRIRNGSEINAHDYSELLKQVVDLLDISMADFSPDLPFNAYGLDSLGATRISQAVRPYASVSQMQLLGGLSWKHLEERIREQTMGDDSVLRRSPTDDVLEMMAQYSKEFAPHIGTDPLPPDDVVLVTGTTGTIGSNVLAQLVADPKVERVYSLNRESLTPLDTRQRIALSERGLDPSVVDSPKVVLLEGTVSQPKLGLPDDLYEELRTSVTHVIHIGGFRNYGCVYVCLLRLKAGESILIWDLLPLKMMSRASATSSTWPSLPPFHPHLISFSPVP
jgi:hypothetical protein